MVELEEEVGLAEAIFDNEAEWPDELVFRRGDILHVLDQQPAGGLADGWWLCADKQGRRGIAPANRLKMIHTFGQGRNRVITPRRFGDVFLYNHRLFDEGTDEFFRQPPAGSLFSSTYDVPTALRNLYLLHGSDHPFLLADKIGNNASSSQSNLLTTKTGGGGISDRRQSIVRNVPIKLEARGEADGALKTSDDYHVVPMKSTSANGNTPAAMNRNRSPPPPPPQRRHFNLSGPLLLSSLVTVPSTSSSGSDEERIHQHSSHELSPRTVNSSSRIDSVRPPMEISNSTPVFSPLNARQSPTSLYDKPSTLLTSKSSHLTPPIDAAFGASKKRDVMQTGVQRRSPIIGQSILNGGNIASNANASAALTTNEVDSIMAMYDVPRSLRAAMMPSSTKKNTYRQQDFSLDANATLQPPNVLTTDSIGAVNADSLDIEQNGETRINGNGRNISHDALKSIMTHGTRAANSSIETDVERLSISSMDSKSSDYQELLSNSSELRLSAAVAVDTLIKLLENLQTVVDKLCTFTTRNWRRREYLESHLVDIRASCRQTIAALKDFFDFSSGAFVNVNRIILASHNAQDQMADANSVDGRLAKHLAHLVRPLGDSLRLLIKLQQTLDISGWMATKLAREGGGNDSLDQFIAVAKQVPQDARQVASFIHGNVSLIFPPTLLNSYNPQPPARTMVPVKDQVHLSVNGSSTNASSSTVSPQQLSSSPQPSIQQQPRTVRFADDVHISTGEITSINGGSVNGSLAAGNARGVLQQNGDSEPNIPSSSKINGGFANGSSSDNENTSSGEDVTDERRSVFDDYDYVGEPGQGGDSTKNSSADSNANTTAAIRIEKNGSILSGEDKQILQFYSPQVENHIACLSNAIDEFLSAVEQNQPPKLFVGHSKFVILGAHKLVYIGDSIAQCLQRKELSEKVKQCADHLCEVLKYCVTATKQAALQYPSVPCVQAMVDSMVNVSHAAYELKLLIQEAASL